MNDQSINITDRIRLVKKLISEGDLVGAIGLFDKVLDDYRREGQADQKIGKLYAQFCRLCIQAGQAHRALDRIEKALAFDEELESALQVAVQDLISRKKLDEALAVSEKMSLLRPSSHVHWVLLGITLTRQRRYGEAETPFQIALTLREESDDACMGLANCYLAQGKNGPAGKCLRRFLEKGHRSQEVYAGLHRLYGNGALCPEDARFFEGEVLIHKARLFLNVGWMYYSHGDRRAAVHNFKQALAMGGRNPQIYLGLQHAVARCREDHAPEAFELGELFRNVAEEVRSAH